MSLEMTFSEDILIELSSLVIKTAIQNAVTIQ